MECLWYGHAPRALGLCGQGHWMGHGCGSYESCDSAVACASGGHLGPGHMLSHTGWQLGCPGHLHALPVTSGSAPTPGLHEDMVSVKTGRLNNANCAAGVPAHGSQECRAITYRAWRGGLQGADSGAAGAAVGGVARGAARRAEAGLPLLQRQAGALQRHRHPVHCTLHGRTTDSNPKFSPIKDRWWIHMDGPLLLMQCQADALKH